MSNTNTLATIKESIISDEVCPELAETATQVVFGEGNAEADIVFIGEAPGKNEDEQGKPFVGAAGKFLDEMLKHIGLQRDDIYITNIVKYRPPNNRDPLPEEKEAFLPYLVKQLEVIKPKLIVTLGRHSMECFLPGMKISDVHGNPKKIKQTRLARVGDLGVDALRGNQSSETGGQDVDGVQGSKEKRTSRIDNTVSEASTQLTPQSATKLGGASGSDRSQDELVLVILPLYHPAAALYNGAMRQLLIDDFAKIPIILKQLETK